MNSPHIDDATDDVHVEDIPATLDALARERIGIEARIRAGERTQADLASKEHRARLDHERAELRILLVREVERTAALEHRLLHIDAVIKETRKRR